MENKDRKFWRDKIAGFLKGKAIALAVKWIGTKAAWLITGPWGWVVNILLTFLWNQFGGPAIRWVIRKGALKVDLAQGRIRIKKINKAKEDEDDETYWDTMSDI